MSDCASCGKPLFKKSDGSFEHERRSSTEKYSGQERRKTEERRMEMPPKREHILHRKWW